MKRPGRGSGNSEEVTTMHQLALFAGSAAAAIFVISQLPMLIKACRTKDLASYSLANIGLANLGNVLYAFYLLQVPAGPAWAVHALNLTTAGVMLALYLRYGWVPRIRSTSEQHVPEPVGAGSDR
jgi:hypothetical protein